MDLHTDYFHHASSTTYCKLLARRALEQAGYNVWNDVENGDMIVGGDGCVLVTVSVVPQSAGVSISIVVNTISLAAGDVGRRVREFMLDPPAPSSIHHGSASFQELPRARAADPSTTWRGHPRPGRH